MIQFNFTVGVEEKSKSNSIGFVLMEQQQQATVSFFFLNNNINNNPTQPVSFVRENDLWMV